MRELSRRSDHEEVEGVLELPTPVAEVGKEPKSQRHNRNPWAHRLKRQRRNRVAHNPSRRHEYHRERDSVTGNTAVYRNVNPKPEPFPRIDRTLNDVSAIRRKTPLPEDNGNAR